MHYQEAAIDELLVKIFLEAQGEAPQEMVIDLDATDLPLHGHQEQRFFHGFYNHYCYLRCISSAAIICWVYAYGPPTWMPARARSRRSNALSGRFGKRGRKPGSSCVPIPASAATA